ncbi:MAG: penicillin acylase family protein [Pseudomonadota bacterium]|nr:penicillin acylase family protein [Pseudomonadota bacterium]
MKILDPFNGLWVNGDKNEKFRDLRLDGLIEPASVHFDDHFIPHISSQNESDLYFAQGFITARDRLWQMEIQSRVAEGSLSEIFGARTIDSDRFFIRSGLRDAALKSHEKMLSDPITKQAVEAYALGVNAYILPLAYRDYPPEYKIFNLKPRRWRSIYSAYIVKMMDFTLTGKSSDAKMSRNLTRYPYKKLLEIFPELPYFSTPFEYINGDIKKNSDNQSDFTPDIFSVEELGRYVEPERGNGSNNWAVSGKKTATGFPIIANDTHLTYRLPNLWYEIQLTTPTQNVYGVSIPGTPGITLGFNKNLAWAVTNATADTFDWYQANARAGHQIGYEIKVRDTGVLRESFAQTPLGPVVYEKQDNVFNDSLVRGFALKWQAQEASNEQGVFLRLNRATSYHECLELLKNYLSPSQNFICADRFGKMGIIHTGKIPIKRSGQGSYVMDGNKTNNTFQEFIPFLELPRSENPKSNFVFSANQNPATKEYPYYLGNEHASNYRARKIKENLAVSNKITPQDMMNLQNDVVGILPRDLRARVVKAIGVSKPQFSLALQALKDWDYSYQTNSIGAAIFWTWFKTFEEIVWQKKLGDRKNYEWPVAETLAYLVLQNPKAEWFDALDSQITEAFNQACFKLLTEFGSDIQNWQWGKVRPTNFPHNAKIPGFSRDNLNVWGDEFTLFSNKGNHGPVYKAVIALGVKPSAWMILPGGPSGNPFNKNYSLNMNDWGKGNFRKVNYYSNMSEVPKNRNLKLQPAGRK